MFSHLVLHGTVIGNVTNICHSMFIILEHNLLSKVEENLWQNSREKCQKKKKQTLKSGHIGIPSIIHLEGSLGNKSILR